MSYYITHSIISGKLVLPLDFINSNEPETITIQNDITLLEGSIEDIDNISARFYKETETKIDELKLKLKKICSNGHINKYGYRISSSVAQMWEETDITIGSFSFNKGELCMATAEGENAYFTKTTNGYELTDIGYTESNGGWVGEIYEKLAKEFNCTISFSVLTEEGETTQVHYYNQNDDEQIISIITNQIENILTDFKDISKEVIQETFQRLLDKSK